MLAVQEMQDFLRKWEKVETVGYIPCRKRNFTGHEDPTSCGAILGSSGVTIGMGVDLGQQSLQELASMQLPKDLLTLLTPYIGKTKEIAMEILYARPLKLDDTEVDMLDDAIFFKYLDRLIKMYDLASPTVPFVQRPAEVQTVLMSLFYQLGSPYSYYSAWQRIWKDLCMGKWADAEKKLRGVRDYHARREDEASLLAELA